MKSMETTKNQEEVTKKTTSTAFLLMFPALVIAGFAALYSPIGISLLSIALAAYQFLMLKKFIQDYYSTR